MNGRDRRWREIVGDDARVFAAPSGLDIGGGDTAGWNRGCDGPLWLSDLDCLSFNDTGHDRRLTWSEAGGYEVLHEDTGGATGAALDAEGRLFLCETMARRVTRIEPDGAVRVLAEGFEGKAFCGPDDIVVHPSGALYFTDWRKPFPPQTADAAPQSGVYRLSSDLAMLDCVLSDCSAPSGLACSPDGQILYVADAVRREIQAYPVGADGSLGEPKTLAAMTGEGAPHGLAVDAAGNLYSGGPGGVWVIDPSGERLGTIAVAASRINALTFGGVDGRTLFIVTPMGIGYVRLATQGVASPQTRGSPRPARKPLGVRQTIERHDAALDRIIAPDAKIQNLASGGFFEDLGGGPDELFARSLEGAVWNQDGNFLFFSDIGNNRRMKWEPGAGLSVMHHPTGHANGATLDREGAILSCEHSGRRVSRRAADETTSVIADRYEGKRLNHPNDVVVRSDGAIFFTDPWWDFGLGDTGETGVQAIYQVSPDLKSITRLETKPFIVPNGLAFSPDEKTLYINDTRHYHIRAYDVLPDGRVDGKSERVFCDLKGDRPGSPDGMKVDMLGNVFCGGAGGLWVISPGGKHLGTIVHGGMQTNNLAFGGGDWKTLFFVSWISLHSIAVLTPGVPVPRGRIG